MTAGWVAASTRGRALARRLIGAEGARSLAQLDWPEARQALAATVYGKEVPADATRPDARHAAMEATSWQLRVLAGWLPPGRGGLARLFAAPLEIANIEHQLASLAGRPPGQPPIRLGSLGVVWPRAARAGSAEAMRAVLAASVWGDPGGVDRTSMALGLRLGLARRMVSQSQILEPWARGGAAVLVARERFAFERRLNDATGRVVDTLLGTHWRSASSVAELTDRLADVAAWPLVDVGDATALWQAETAVALRVASEAEQLVASSAPNRGAVIGCMALLLIDLRRALAAIEVAGREPDPVEVFDAVA